MNTRIKIVKYGISILFEIICEIRQYKFSFRVWLFTLAIKNHELIARGFCYLFSLIICAISALDSISFFISAFAILSTSGIFLAISSLVFR